MDALMFGETLDLRCDNAPKLFVRHAAEPLGEAEMMFVCESRRRQVLRARFENDRLRSLAAGYLIGRYLGVDEAEFEHNAQGKPYLPNGPRFSVTHGGRYAALAVFERCVGVDIEPVRSVRRAVAERYFTRDEADLLNTLSGADADGAFFKMWTGKEAVIKAVGRGFALKTNDFAVLPERDSDSGGVVWADGRKWNLAWREIEGHMLCCAW